MLRRWIAAALSQFRLFGRFPNDNAENYLDDAYLLYAKTCGATTLCTSDDCASMISTSPKLCPPISTRYSAASPKPQSTHRSSLRINALRAILNVQHPFIFSLDGPIIEPSLVVWRSACVEYNTEFSLLSQPHSEAYAQCVREQSQM